MKILKFITRKLNLAFNLLGYEAVTLQKLKNLRENDVAACEYFLLKKYLLKDNKAFFDNIERSKAQNRQDLFALFHSNFKREGYFVEFGATDGVNINNTYLLEKEFNWQGILAEPGRVWHKALEGNRSAHIEKSCVWRETGIDLIFNEAELSELSTISGFGDDDNHKSIRRKGQEYTVPSISLLDMLIKYNAPNIIDFLSVDTEGSEFTILENFPFDKYIFRSITIEHNYTSQRNLIYNLLVSNGYKRVMEKISKYDDWYVYNG